MHREMKAAHEARKPLKKRKKIKYGSRVQHDADRLREALATQNTKPIDRSRLPPERTVLRPPKEGSAGWVKKLRTALGFSKGGAVKKSRKKSIDGIARKGKTRAKDNE